MVASPTSAPGLDHPTRRRIYDHLLVLPGDHFRSIVRSLGIAHGTATHHLAVLVRKGLVCADRRGGRCRYYPRGAGAEAERNQLYQKHWNFRDLRLRVLFVTKNLEATKAAAVGRALGISRQLASYHLERLTDLGLVRREDGRYHAQAAPAGSASPPEPRRGSGSANHE
ncbi:MAG: MarR family transcriptional regulator [Methanobacteriota archaeon]